MEFHFRLRFSAIGGHHSVVAEILEQILGIHLTELVNIGHFCRVPLLIVGLLSVEYLHDITCSHMTLGGTGDVIQSVCEWGASILGQLCGVFSL